MFTSNLRCGVICACVGKKKDVYVCTCVGFAIHARAVGDKGAGCHHSVETLSVELNMSICRSACLNGGFMALDAVMWRPSSLENNMCEISSFFKNNKLLLTLNLNVHMCVAYAWMTPAHWLGHGRREGHSCFGRLARHPCSSLKLLQLVPYCWSLTFSHAPSLKDKAQ